MIRGDVKHRHATLLHYVKRRREKEMKSGIKSLFLFVFAHKKYSRRFINLRLSNWSHLDYINNVFNTFSVPASYSVHKPVEE